METEPVPTEYVVKCRLHGVIAEVHSVVEGSTVIEEHQLEHEGCGRMSVEPVFTKAEFGLTWD